MRRRCVASYSPHEGEHLVAAGGVLTCFDDRAKYYQPRSKVFGKRL